MGRRRPHRSLERRDVLDGHVAREERRGDRGARRAEDQGHADLAGRCIGQRRVAAALVDAACEQDDGLRE